MRTSTKAGLLFALALPSLGGCGASDQGTTGVKYDSNAVQQKAMTNPSAMPPQARAAMERAMGGAGAKGKP